MRAENNTWGHYQDTRVEWLLDDATRAHLVSYRDAGVVALLFGGGAGGVTCACDASNDGRSNSVASRAISSTVLHIPCAGDPRSSVPVIPSGRSTASSR